MEGYCPILIIADSRGRYLRRELDRVFVYLDYTLIWRPGLKLIDVADFARATILRTKPKLIYILAGICDVTHVISRSPWTVAMRHPSVQETISTYMYHLDSCHSEIYPLHRIIGYRQMLIFPTQTGIDLEKYNGRWTPFNCQQPILNAAMLAINRHIVALNLATGVRTPFLATPVHPRTKRRNRFASNKLEDGCHPSRYLAWIWAKKIRENAYRNIDNYEQYALVNSMY